MYIVYINKRHYSLRMQNNFEIEFDLNDVQASIFQSSANINNKETKKGDHDHLTLHIYMYTCQNSAKMSKITYIYIYIYIYSSSYLVGFMYVTFHLTGYIFLHPRVSSFHSLALYNVITSIYAILQFVFLQNIS